MLKKYFFGLVFLILVGARLGYGDDADNNQINKFVLPNAQNIIYNGSNRVNFEMPADVSPEGLLTDVDQRLSQDGWTKQDPPKGTSNVVGISESISDAQGVQHNIVFQWVQIWSNEKKETVGYSLGYMSDEDPQSDLKNLKVQVDYVAAEQ